MALDQGQGQLADLAGQVLQALVFGNPCADLVEQVPGHINGARLAPFLERQVVRLVQRPAVVAGARRLSALFVHLRQAGRQHRTCRRQLLQAALQHPPDLRWMARHAHDGAPGLTVSSRSTV